MNESDQDKIYKERIARYGNPVKIGVLQKEEGKPPYQVRCVEDEKGESLPPTVENALEVAKRLKKTGKTVWIQKLWTDAFKNKSE